MMPVLAESQPLRIVTDVAYTRDGTLDPALRSAAEGYLRLALGRQFEEARFYGRDEYLRECRAQVQLRPGTPCALPDLTIRLQLGERRGEAFFSGDVGGKGRSQTLRGGRVDVREFAKTLYDTVTEIEKIVADVLSPPASRRRIATGCFRVEARDGDVAPATAEKLADALPHLLELLARNERRGRVAFVLVPVGDCNSVEQRQAAAQAEKADALLSATISLQERRLSVTPEFVLPGAAQPLRLAALRAEDPTPDGAQREIALKLSAASSALFGAGEVDELRGAIAGNVVSRLYLERAKARLGQQPPDYRSADVMLEAVMAGEPTAAEPYLLFAQSLRDQRNYDRATEILRRGIDRVAEKLQLSELYLALAENRSRVPDQPGVRKVYQEANEKGLLQNEAAIGIAQSFFEEGNHAEALRAAETAIGLNPGNPAGYFIAAKTHEKAGEPRLAVAVYRRGLARVPAAVAEGLRTPLAVLYEEWAQREISTTDRSGFSRAIRHLSESIKLAPSIQKYYDRAVFILEETRTHRRIEGYRRASRDYLEAEKLVGKDNLLRPFPYLMPNLIETLILEGRFDVATDRAKTFFTALASDQATRPTAEILELRLITSFLNAAAALLQSGSAEKEIYLLENAMLGVKWARQSWSFGLMLNYLDRDYPKLMPKVSAQERARRVAAVKVLIKRVEERPG